MRAARRQAASGLVAALVAALLQAQERAKPLEFKTEVGAVYVDAFVTRGDRPLADLGASAFELLDNGVPQQLELLSAESRPLRAVLVFDTSSSMAGDRLLALRAASEAFLDGLRPADEAALVAFNEDVVWLSAPTPDKAKVRQALARLRAEGATSVYDALYAGITLSEGERRALIVLFTDGQDNTSWLGEGTCARSPSARTRSCTWSAGARCLRPKSCARPRCRASRHRSARSARSPKPRAVATGRRTRPSGCGGRSVRSPTRWATATCCATSPQASRATAGTGSTRDCAASKETSTFAAATGSLASRHKGATRDLCKEASPAPVAVRQDTRDPHKGTRLAEALFGISGPHRSGRRRQDAVRNILQIVATENGALEPLKEEGPCDVQTGSRR